jgi:hypothetical protein
MENKTKIIITRKSEWMNRLRSYTIFIDGAEAGFVKNGSSEEFNVQPGEHTVYCKLNWFYSPEFKTAIHPDEIEYLRVKSGMRFYYVFVFLFLAGILVNFYYKQSHIHRPQWVWWMVICTLVPYILYILYYFTIGRKKYFILEKDSENVFAK